MRIFILASFFLFQFSSQNILTYAQGCCTSGSSTFGGFERGLSEINSFNLGLSFIRNNLNSSFNENVKIDDPLGRSASVSIINIEAEFGVAEKISVLAIAGYSIRERETEIRSSTDNSVETINFKGSGINDITILTKYGIIIPSILSQFGFSIGGGVKLPVGSYTQENEGTRLSIDLQPGTGATDVLLWSSFYKGFPDLSISLFLNFLYRYPGSNLDSYRFGDEYIFALNGEYYITDYLTFSLGIRSRFAEEDFWRDRYLPSTGGTYFDVLPAVVYSESIYQLRLFYQSPLYRNVKGIQLTTSSIIGTELLFSFNLVN
jgi:hypothetical protein